jgi:antitoxin component of RelBE/YafQ-DinJ toxin-antitoxin module
MYTAYGHVADILSTLVKEPNCKVNYEFLMSVLPASLCEEERGIPLSAVEKEIHSLSSIPYEGICSVQTGTEDHIVRENRRLEFELKVARENLEEMGMTYRAILGKCEDMQKDLELLNNIKHFLNATAEKQALPVVNFYSTNAFTAQEVNLLRQISRRMRRKIVGF